MAREQRLLGKRIGYFMIRALSVTIDKLARVLPLSWLRGIATCIGYLIYLFIPSRQRLARNNIRQAFGERFTPAQRRRIALQATINICKTMIELFKMRYMSSAEIKSLVSPEGVEHIRAAFQQGRGVIVITAHFGNWEIGGARFAADGFPVVVLARDANEGVTANLINQARTCHDITILGRDDLRAMLRVLRSNKGIGILPDQHAAEGGIIADFLGRPASTAPGPAVLALRTDCPVIPFFTRRKPDGTFHSQVLPPIEISKTGDRQQDIKALTEKINQVIGQQISTYPEQWLWLHNRWKVNPDTVNK